MNELARVVAVEHLGGFLLKLTFSDDLVRELDFEGTLVDQAFENLNDPDVFAQVGIDRIAGTITWPNGIDLDPDVLHGDHRPASGSAPVVVREYHLHATG